MLGLSACNLYGQDGSAVWQNVVGQDETSVRSDVHGRQWAMLIVFLPRAILVTVPFLLLSQAWWTVPVLLAAIPAVFGAAAGIAILVSAIGVSPGVDPRRRLGPNDANGNIALHVWIVLLLVPVAVLPTAGMIVWSQLTGEPVARRRGGRRRAAQRGGCRVGAGPRRDRLPDHADAGRVQPDPVRAGLPGVRRRAAVLGGEHHAQGRAGPGEPEAEAAGGPARARCPVTVSDPRPSVEGMAEFRDADLHDARFTMVDLTGATFRAVGFHQVVMRNVEITHTTIDGEIEDLVINGVDVAPLVEAELDRRFPDRPCSGRPRPTVSGRRGT